MQKWPTRIIYKYNTSKVNVSKVDTAKTVTTKRNTAKISITRPHFRTAIMVALFIGIVSASYPLIAAPIFTANNNVTHQSLLPFVDIYEDHAGVLSPQQIVTDEFIHQFSPLSSPQIHFGFNQKTYWLRFTIQHQSQNPAHYILEIAPAILDQIDLYQYSKGTLVWLQHSGSFTPYNERQIQHPLHLFELNPPPNELTTYYLKISSRTSINVKLSLSSFDNFAQYDLRRNSWTSLIYGIPLSLIFVQLGFAIIFKKAQHIVYAFYIISLLCLQITWSGSFYHLFPSKSQLPEQTIIFLIYSASFISVTFARLYLNTKTLNSRGNKILITTEIIAAITAISVWFTDLPNNADFAVFFVLATTGILLSFIIFDIIQENSKALSYLIARFFSFFIITMTLAYTIGLISYSPILQIGIVASLAAEALLITLFMSYYQIIEQHNQTGSSHTNELKETLQHSHRELIRKISHDIRTSLSGISGMSELVLDGPLTATQRKQVSIIKNAGDGLLALISNLTTSANTEPNELELQHISFNLPALVSECIDIYQAQAEEKQLELISDIHHSIPKLVRGDPNRLQQIIMHLLSLTFANSNQGEIMVSVSLNQEDRLIHFDIVNTRASDIKKLKSALSLKRNNSTPSDSTITQEFVIAHQLVVLMGGQLGIEPYQKEGLRFWFTANMPTLALDQNTEREYDNILRERRLLVVDDNKTFRQLIQQQASSWGIQITSARNGAEALAILRSQAILDEQFDVIIVDYQMPTMNGLQLAEKIQEDPLLANVLIIMLTGVTKAPTTTEARNAGIRRVLTKPVSAQSLKITLAEEFAFFYSKMTEP